MFHASATTLTGLNVKVDGDGLMKLADIDLPFLHELVLFITTENEDSRTSAAAFITAQRAIRKLDLRGKIHPLPQIPPDALTNLQVLNASTELVDQLVPGRPVEAIEVSSSHGCHQDWFGEEVARSTARVRKLRVHLNTAILDTRMVKRMVTILPFLESLWLPVFDDVSGPFRSIALAHSPSDTPQCRRSPHFPQVPQGPTFQSVSSRNMGRSQRQRDCHQTAECKFILLISRDSGRWCSWVEKYCLSLE